MRMDVFNILADLIAKIDIIDTCNMLIAVIALIATIISTHKQQEFNKNSFLPICNIHIDCTGLQFTIKIENAGNGPMFIEKIFYKDGEKKKSYLTGLFPRRDSELGQAALSESFEYHPLENSFNGKGIGAGKEVSIFDASFASRDELKAFGDKSLNVTIYVQYRDIYSKKGEYKEEYREFKGDWEGYKTVMGILSNEAGALQ